jgi:hypothetical protein
MFLRLPKLKPARLFTLSQVEVGALLKQVAYDFSSHIAKKVFRLHLEDELMQEKRVPVKEFRQRFRIDSDKLELREMLKKINTPVVSSSMGGPLGWKIIFNSLIG